MTNPAAGPGQGWAFTVLLLGVFFEAFLGVRVTGAVTVGDALILLSGAIVLVDAARRRTRLWLPWWVIVALPLFSAGPVINALFIQTATRDDMVYFATLVFCIFVIPVVIASQRAHDRSPELLAVAWALGNAVGAFVAYLQFHGWEPAFLQHWLGWRMGNRVPGLNSNPNILGEALAIVTPMAVAFALDTKSWLRAAAWAGVTVLYLHGADLTGSRASVAAGAAGGLVTLALFTIHTRKQEIPRRLAQIAVLATVLAIFMAVRAGSYDSAIQRLLGHSDTAKLSNWIRHGLAAEAVRVFEASPFLGNGYGGLTFKAHSVWLGILECGGLLGLIGLLITQAGFAVQAVRGYWLALRSRPGLAVPFGVIGCWCAWLAVGLYQLPVLHRHGHIVFGLSVLWYAIALRQRGSETPSPAYPSVGHLAHSAPGLRRP